MRRCKPDKPQSAMLASHQDRCGAYLRRWSVFASAPVGLHPKEQIQRDSEAFRPEVSRHLPPCACSDEIRLVSMNVGTHVVGKKPLRKGT